MHLRLLLSEETLPHIDLWKEAAELIRIAPPLVGTRREAPHPHGPFAAALKRGYTPTKTMEISSTDIRARVEKGLYCGHLVPAKALDYIHTHRLYS